MLRLGLITAFLTASSVAISSTELTNLNQSERLPTLLSAQTSGIYSEGKQYHGNASDFSINSSYAANPSFYTNLFLGHSQTEDVYKTAIGPSQNCDIGKSRGGIAFIAKPIDSVSIKTGYTQYLTQWCAWEGEETNKEERADHTGEFGVRFSSQYVNASSTFNRTKSHFKEAAADQDLELSNSGLTKISSFLGDRFEVGYGRGMYETNSLNEISLNASLTFSQGTFTAGFATTWEDDSELKTYSLSLAVYPGKSTSIRSLFHRF